MSVKTFTERLCDLYIEKKLDLTECLSIISGDTEGAERKKSRDQKAAFDILSALNNGSLFSTALKSCRFLDFDRIFVSFITFSERTGDLRGTLIFLRERLNRKETVRNKLFEALAYPVFVILLAVGACCLLIFKGEQLFGGIQLFGESEKIKLIKMLCFLVAVSVCLIFVIGKTVGENRLYEAFLGMGFLIQAGVSLGAAVSYGSLIVGTESKMGKIFLEAKEKLEFGMDLSSAFKKLCIPGSVCGIGSANKKIGEAFYYAKKSGGKTDVFEKLALWIDLEDSKKRKLCFAFIEPAFIAITGIFLLGLVINILMPAMGDMSWAL